MSKKNKEQIEKAKSTIDFETGLSLQQIQAAKLMAQGYTQGRAAKAVGVHHNTVNNWFRKSGQFQRIVDTYKVDDMECLTMPIEELTVDELDDRLVKLVGQSILAFEGVLKARKSSDMAKVQAGKFVFSTLYWRLTQSSQIAPKQLDDLRSALKIVTSKS